MSEIPEIAGAQHVPSFNVAPIKNLIARAKKRGVVTYDEINAAMPSDQHSFEQIEHVLSELSEMGVNVVEHDSLDEVVTQGQKVDLSREEESAQPQPNTVFDLIEKNPPQYDAWWAHPPSWPLDDHPAHNKLTLSFIELESLGSCGNLGWLKKTYFGTVGHDEQISAGDAQAAGCSFDDVFWAAGTLSAYSPSAASRLTDFAADCLQRLADRIEPGQLERDTLLDTIRATRDFADGICSVGTLIKETDKAQQAWMRVVEPLDAGVSFPWDRFFSDPRRNDPIAFIPPKWKEWASGIAWAVATCRALRPRGDTFDCDTSRRWDVHESWLLSCLVERFACNEAMPNPVHLDDDAFLRRAGPGQDLVARISLIGAAFAVLPEGCRRIEVIDGSYAIDCDLPYSLRSIGSIDLDRCYSAITIADGVEEIGSIDLMESRLALPTSVERVGNVVLYGEDDCLECDLVVSFGNVKLSHSSFTFPDGVETIGGLAVESSNVHLPSSLKAIGDVLVQDESWEEYDPPRTIYWKDGPTEVGHLELSEGIQMLLPRSMQTIQSVRLAPSAHLRLFEDTVINGPCEIAERATLARLPYSHYEHVDCIDLTGDETFEVPDTVRSIGALSLLRCDNFTVPEGVMQIDSIELDECYLNLPASVRRIGRVTLQRYDSCLLCPGVQQFGDIHLQSSDFEVPAGVVSIESLHVIGSTCRLPKTLKTVGNIFVDDPFKGDRGETDALSLTLQWQEGPTAIGSVELGENVEMSLPRSVRTIASVDLARGSKLRLPLEAVITGQCEVREGANLERLPASVSEPADRVGGRLA